VLHFREMITSLLLCHAIVQDFLDKLPSPVDTDAGPFRYTQYVQPPVSPRICILPYLPPPCVQRLPRLFSLSLALLPLPACPLTFMDTGNRQALSPSPPTAH
jgi:hypothetical protein